MRSCMRIVPPASTPAQREVHDGRKRGSFRRRSPHLKTPVIGARRKARLEPPGRHPPLVAVNTAEDRPEILRPAKREPAAPALRLESHFVTCGKAEPVRVKAGAVVRVIDLGENTPEPAAGGARGQPMFLTRPLPVPGSAKRIRLRRRFSRETTRSAFPFPLKGRASPEQQRHPAARQPNPVPAAHGGFNAARNSRICAFSPRKATIEQISPCRCKAATQPSYSIKCHG